MAYETDVTSASKTTSDDTKPAATPTLEDSSALDEGADIPMTTDEGDGDDEDEEPETESARTGLHKIDLSKDETQKYVAALADALEITPTR